MNKTVVISVNYSYKSLIYKKKINSFKKYYAHDNFNLCKKNDYVYILKVKPISLLKFWKVISFL